MKTKTVQNINFLGSNGKSQKMYTVVYIEPMRVNSVHEQVRHLGNFIQVYFYHFRFTLFAIIRNC